MSSKLNSKEILIIFCDAWIKFSPSILNLVQMLEKCNVRSTVLFYDNSLYNSDNLNFSSCKISFNPKWEIFLSRIRCIRIIKVIAFYIKAKKIIKDKSIEGVIGVDDLGYLTAKLAGRHSIYYSLEINRNILNRLIFNWIHPFLIIQSIERKNYLADSLVSSRVALIQNSPIIEKLNFKKFKNNGFLYFGNLLKEHGVELCIEAIDSLDGVLTIKYFAKMGSDEYLDSLKVKYKKLIDSGKVIFDDKYIAQEELIGYISSFKIGFVFYESNTINKSFNYESSPSGKLFNYLAAGVPVIGSDIVGFNLIKNYKAGILIKNLGVTEIVLAVREINKNLKLYEKNANNAMKYLAYNKMFYEQRRGIFNNLGILDE